MKNLESIGLLIRYMRTR